MALEMSYFPHDFDQKPAGVRHMGGPGSGNWYRWDKRTTLDEVKRLDVRWLHRQGYLDGWPRLITWHRGERQTGSVSVTMQDGRLAVEYRARRRGTSGRCTNADRCRDRAPLPSQRATGA